MSWHYRVFKVIEGGDKYFCIKEYYPRLGAIVGKKTHGGDVWTENPCAPFGETKSELIRDLKCMLSDAQKHPIKVERIKNNSERLVDLGGTEKALRPISRRR